MITGWLIYSKEDVNRNQSYIHWFIDEAKKQQITLTLILREYLHIGIYDQKLFATYKNRSITLPNFAVVRTVEPLLNKHLELLGIKVFNSYKVSKLCNHKINTYMEINQLGIPIMDTIFTTKHHLQKIPPVDYPFVVKEAKGRSGKQVFYIKNPKDWLQTLDTFSSNDLVIQSANVQKGKDLRVFVIGKEIIGAVLRKNKDDFRANFTLGGTATWYHLSDQERKIIEKIVYAYDFDLVGIDFLIDYEGNLIFNEIEDVVGSRILSAVSDINLLEKYITHIQTKL